MEKEIVFIVITLILLWKESKINKLEREIKKLKG